LSSNMGQCALGTLYAGFLGLDHSEGLFPVVSICFECKNYGS
jgi:hypothetical protein